MEKVKFETGVTYELAPGNCFDGQEVTVTFLLDTATFDMVEADVKATQTLIMLDSAGDMLLTRSGLVYGGYLAKMENYTIGAEQVQNGTNEAGESVYETQDIKATVMIAKFRVPDLREDYATLSARLEYMAMMSGIEMEV